MIRARYSDFQQQLARVSGVTGMSPTDPRVMTYTNLAIFELMNEGDWPSLIARLQFRLTQPRVVLPAEFDRILYLTVNHSPIPMQSPWFEFVGDGPDFADSIYGVGSQNVQNDTLLKRFIGVLDREQIYTFEDVPQDGNVYYPVIYGTVSELSAGTSNRPILVLEGYDSNNQWIRTQSIYGGWIDGMELPINGDTSPFSTVGTISISQVTGITKPVTNGNVQLYAYCAAANKNVYLGNYTPYDTVPYYRSYKIPGLENNVGQQYHVIARCRRRYFPIVSPNDFLLITNLPALTSMLQAVYYRESKDPQNYAAYKAIAIDILRKEMTAYIGQQRTKPAITFGEGTGVRRDGMYIL
jgi:hypothetical protein